MKRVSYVGDFFFLLASLIVEATHDYFDNKSKYSNWRRISQEIIIKVRSIFYMSFFSFHHYTLIIEISIIPTGKIMRITHWWNCCSILEFNRTLHWKQFFVSFLSMTHFLAIITFAAFLIEAQLTLDYTAQWNTFICLKNYLKSPRYIVMFYSIIFTSST